MCRFKRFPDISAQYHGLCCKFAISGPLLVVSVEYRLAPEHRFPAAICDAHAGLLWCSTSDHPILSDCGAPGKRRIIVAGDSAGGNLAASLAILARDGLDGELQPAPEILLVHTLLIYPTVHV